MKLLFSDYFSTEFYAFSEFWYTSEDVLKLGGVYVFDKFKQASQVRLLIWRKAESRPYCIIFYVTLKF
jgi:Golgi nucleoside diphosphatase